MRKAGREGSWEGGFPKREEKRRKGIKLLKRSELDSQHPLEYIGAHRGFRGKYVRATSLLILASTVP